MSEAGTSADRWVIKLGGSLWSAPELRRWLAVAATAPGPPRLLVPGGGPFADAVRHAQDRMRFDNRAAHEMAILAMQQFATALSGLEPRLRACSTLDDLETASSGLWFPWPLAATAPTLTASWEVTSDSIAAWLAAQLPGSGLALVKSAALDARTATPAELVRSGLCDEAFPRYLEGMKGPALLLQHRRPQDLETILAGGAAGLAVHRTGE